MKNYRRTVPPWKFVRVLVKKIRLTNEYIQLKPLMYERVSICTSITIPA